MISFQTACKIVSDRLLQMGNEMNEFGSALPIFKNKPQIHLAISQSKEYDFGWVFYYNTKEYLETNDNKYLLGGNAPFIVDKNDNKLYITGTAKPIEYYIEEFRKGNKNIVI